MLPRYLRLPPDPPVLDLLDYHDGRQVYGDLFKGRIHLYGIVQRRVLLLVRNADTYGVKADI